MGLWGGVGIQPHVPLSGSFLDTLSSPYNVPQILSSFLPFPALVPTGSVELDYEPQEVRGQQGGRPHLLEGPPGAREAPRVPLVTPLFMLRVILRTELYAHFTDTETEAQGGEEIARGEQSREATLCGCGAGEGPQPSPWGAATEG